MDDLANKLRADAEQIEVSVSAQLDDRIRASLEGASQDKAVPARKSQPASFWWASSLTGIAATLLVIVIVNLTVQEPEPAITEPPLPQQLVGQFDWHLEPAVLTQTLEQELVAIQSDLKKAEQRVREDIEQVVVSGP